jgi:hypothetical protein
MNSPVAGHLLHFLRSVDPLGEYRGNTRNASAASAVSGPNPSGPGCYSPAWRSTSRSLTSATESLYAASDSL